MTAGAVRLQRKLSPLRPLRAIDKVLHLDWIEFEFMEIRRRNNGLTRPLRTGLANVAGGWILLAAIAGCGRSEVSDKEDSSSPAESAEASARGEEIASKMLATYRDAKSYADHATYVEQTVLRGEGIERQRPLFLMTLALERPNKLRLKFQETTGGDTGPPTYDIASDGARMLATVSELPSQVLQTSAPPTLDAANLIPDPLIREVLDGKTLSDVFPQLAMLVNVDDQSLVFPEDEGPRLIGAEKLRGRDCYRVASTSPAGTRVFWIDRENYTLHRMELPIGIQRESSSIKNQYTRFNIWIDFEDPTFNAAIDPQSFALQSPEGARRVSHFVVPPPPGPSDAVGAPIAEFELTTADGEKLSPASLAGKTVLFDFWAVNCPHCKAQTPVLEKVYREFKGSEDVVVYGVNINGDEASATVVDKTFRNWGRTMPVLRDISRGSFERLNVEGTPMLMLLGPDGRLQYLHVERHNDPAGLIAIIRRLKGGADLAAEARAEHAKTVANYEKALAEATIADN